LLYRTGEYSLIFVLCTFLANIVKGTRVPKIGEAEAALLFVNSVFLNENIVVLSIRDTPKKEE
jgi:hypothetical protein